MDNTTSAAQQQQQQLNLLTPMALLPPDIAFQTTIAAYVFVACSGIMIWDILDNLKDDYAMLRHYRMKLPTAAYFLSRIFSLGFVILITVFQTAQISDCKQFEVWMAWIYTAAMASTSLLFTLRVRAIYEGNRYITVFFVLLWLVVLGTALMTTQGDTAGQIGSTMYCANEHFAGYVTTSAITPLVNDTLVFLAISWRLMQNTLVGDGRKFCLRAMILGQRMPAFSRALLKDGQIYYLTTISTNLLTVVLMLIHPVPEVYRTMLAGPNVMLMNIMACRVFRKTKLGLFSSTTTQSTIPTMYTENTATSASYQRDGVHGISPIIFRKFSSRGDPLEATHNITIDLGTKELGIEHPTTTELYNSNPDNMIERGLGEKPPERAEEHTKSLTPL